MTLNCRTWLWSCGWRMVILGVLMVRVLSGPVEADEPPILTPPPPAQPRVNGPAVFGVRPGSPFLYTIPATGQAPLQFSVEGLPTGLKLDAATGRITGVLRQPGEFKVVLQVHNVVGKTARPFRIVAGERIALTPPMGWNSWNCWAQAVDQDKVLRSARARHLESPKERKMDCIAWPGPSDPWCQKKPRCHFGQPLWHGGLFS